MEIIKIGRIQPVQRLDIHQQFRLVLFQTRRDALDLVTHLFVALYHFDGIATLAEQAIEPARFAVWIQAAEVEAT